jgi:hypothetical protein
LLQGVPQTAKEAQLLCVERRKDVQVLIVRKARKALLGTRSVRLTQAKLLAAVQ